MTAEQLAADVAAVQAHLETLRRNLEAAG